MEASITLSPAGRLDTTNAEEFNQTLTDAFKNYTHVEIDMSRLSYISSAGLRTLLAGQKTARARNAEMTVTNVGSAVMYVFRMTRFDALLKIM